MAAEVKVEIGSFPMPFRLVFKHTSAARAATENIVVRLSDPGGPVGYGEGCPRSYVTGETDSSARAFLAEHGNDLATSVADVDGLETWIDLHQSVIDRNPAAFCALELAMLDLLARRSEESIESLLDRPELHGPFTYSAVLGDGDPLTYGAQVVRYRLGGLRHFKVKLSGDADRDLSKLRWFRGRFGALVANSVRVDANNLWTDPEVASAYLRRLDFPLLGIEEPLTANDLEGFLAIAEAIDSRVILDESLLREGQIDQLPGDATRWILNCRISKSGGLLRSLRLIDGAIDAGLGIIVGAHVGETSLLTRAALTAAAGAGSSLLAQEGAFGTYLLTEDLCLDPIMFGRRGSLGRRELASIGAHGLGVSVIDDRLTGLQSI